MSEPAIKRYAELKGISLFPQKEKYYTIYWLEPERETTLNARDIERNDPILVQVVEELGENANGSFADLQITKVEKGSLYRISEYDGLESVMTVDSYDWSIA